ncbi:hybrid sensor histidine kinase/response regulator [Geobacter sp. FeAm09]|uniref:hybrid sensor histidine kinase/response regulator n=1 Tax=Geobacter sp. FeAm09 TaxID=2597769 RepID=UPI0011EC41E8|nr:hybrid sensor histidine kinase/response regulator [Geobacter sp. FeAm09]QEM69448.1 hybrid sensor histidine kinase/response regulator [Geobacter sp. FeAm09]
MQHNEGLQPSNKPETVLIVDDEQVIRELCEKVLKEYRILQAGNCAEALQLYQQEHCDLILADVMMPGGSGIDLLSQVKSLDPNAVVIIMTGFSQKEIILNALKEGADDFINKPLNLLQLRTAVEKSLARKRLREELASLKRLDRFKSNFLSLISHKLRTPITAISLFLQNVERGIYDQNDQIFRQNIKLVNNEVEYLGRLVSDLLSFSKVMEGREGLSLEPCDLNSILVEVIGASERKEGIETEFHPSPLPVLQLDRGKITFAFQQVIENAYKFSGETGQVSITLRSTGDAVHVAVADTGIGIPRDELSKVFEKFYQADPDNAGQVRGFGLGLFYAREFVRQHGGSITIDSVPQQGSTVTVTLPLQ